MNTEIKRLQAQVEAGIAAALRLKMLEMPPVVYIKIDGTKPAHDQFNAFSSISNSVQPEHYVRYVRSDIADLPEQA